MTTLVRGRDGRRRTPLASLSLLSLPLLTVLLAGCGIRSTQVPTDFGPAPSRVPCALSGQDITTQSSRGIPVQVFLICSGQLVTVDRSVRIPDGTAEGARRVLVAQGLLDELAETPSTPEQQAGLHDRCAGRDDGERASAQGPRGRAPSQHPSPGPDFGRPRPDHLHLLRLRRRAGRRFGHPRRARRHPVAQLRVPHRRPRQPHHQVPAVHEGQPARSQGRGDPGRSPGLRGAGNCAARPHRPAAEPLRAAPNPNARRRTVPAPPRTCGASLTPQSQAHRQPGTDPADPRVLGGVQRQGEGGGSAVTRVRAAGALLLVAHLALVAWITLRPLDVPWVSPANLRPFAYIRADLALGPTEAARRMGEGLGLLAPLGVLLPMAAWQADGVPARLPRPHGRRGRPDLAGHRTAADRRSRPGRGRRLPAAQHGRRRPGPSRDRAGRQGQAPPPGRDPAPRGPPPGGHGSGSDPDDSQGRHRPIERRFAPFVTVALKTSKPETSKKTPKKTSMSQHPGIPPRFTKEPS